MTKSYQDLRAGMSPESIEISSRKAIKMNEEYQQYLDDLQTLSNYFDRMDDLSGAEVIHMVKINRRVDYYEDVVVPMRTPQEIVDMMNTPPTEVLLMSDEDFSTMMDILENPPEPSEKLREAFRKHSEHVVKKEEE